MEKYISYDDYMKSQGADPEQSRKWLTSEQKKTVDWWDENGDRIINARKEREEETKREKEVFDFVRLFVEREYPKAKVKHFHSFYDTLTWGITKGVVEKARSEKKEIEVDVQNRTLRIKSQKIQGQEPPKTKVEALINKVKNIEFTKQESIEGLIYNVVREKGLFKFLK